MDSRGIRDEWITDGFPFMYASFYCIFLIKTQTEIGLGLSFCHYLNFVGDGKEADEMQWDKCEISFSRTPVISTYF